jgi:hypothetical protein
MPSGPRVRTNNIYGSVSDNPLLIGAVSFTSLGLSKLPPISGQHAVIVLDPKRVYGEPEIVVVTSHSSMGTTATVTRGQYGTTARQHPLLTAWAHVPIDEDFIPILTSGTRPADPYRGQMIFETDTNKYVARSITDAWIDAIPLGAWTSYTGAAPTPTAGTFTTVSGSGAYARIGRSILYRYKVTITSVGSATGDLVFDLPAVAATGVVTFGSGRENGISGTLLTVYGAVSGKATIQTGAAMANGKIYDVAGNYEAVS